MLGLYHHIDIALTAWRIHSRGDPEVRLLPTLVGQGRRAIDIGANRGVFAYWLSRCCRAVEAFEPNPVLAAALAGARLRGVNVHAMALSNRPGDADLLVPPHRKGGFDTPSAHLSRGVDEAAAARHKVKLARLDDFAFREVDFIKIDVEGFEEEVLEGGWRTIAAERPIMLIELVERLRHGCGARLRKRIGEAGYIVRFRDQEEWLRIDRLSQGEIGPSGRFIANFLFVPEEKAHFLGGA